MIEKSYSIHAFDRLRHADQVVDLWRSVFGYETAHNDPTLVIEKKVQVSDGLFFIAETTAGQVVGTVMCGYDGHRGWIYSLAVSPPHQRRGVGSELMNHAEKVLKDMGCLKINIQIMEGNEKVEKFYQRLGYATERRISMGKRIPENVRKVDQVDDQRSGGSAPFA